MTLQGGSLSELEQIATGEVIRITQYTQNSGTKLEIKHIAFFQHKVSSTKYEKVRVPSAEHLLPSMWRLKYSD